MSLEKRIKDLELLALSREHQKNFNRDYRLQKKGLYEQSEDIFKPLIQQQEKQTEVIKALEPKLKAIEGLKPNLPIQLKTNNIGSEHLSKTWRFKQNADGDFFFNDKLLLIENGIIRLANSPHSYPFTDNLQALLNGANIDSINDKDDLVNYNNLATEAKSSKNSGRSETING